jgi:hypothetical protein
MRVFGATLARQRRHEFDPHSRIDSQPAYDPKKARITHGVYLRNDQRALTNVRLAASALRRGLKLEAYGGVISRADTSERVQPQSEREVFELCGVPYLEPNQR